MATIIRADISRRNKYWIGKHRHYELKHFCLQYNDWKKAYLDILNLSMASSNLERLSDSNGYSDRTAKHALLKAYYSERINMLEQAAIKSDHNLYEYILKAVTEGRSYTYLKTKMNIPCGKDLYYDRYRKFFYILSSYRD